MNAPRIDPSNDSDAGSLNVFRTLWRNRELHDAFMGMFRYLIYGGGLPQREREIVILRVGWRSGSEYEFAQHRRVGKQAGLTDEEITSLATAIPALSSDDRSLVALVDELCRDDVVSDETWAELRRRWSEEHLIELVMLAGFYRMVSGFLSTIGVQIEPGASGWPEGHGDGRAVAR